VGREDLPTLPGYQDKQFKKKLLPENPLPKPINTGHARPITEKSITQQSTQQRSEQHINTLADKLIKTTLENLNNDK